MRETGRHILKKTFDLNRVLRWRTSVRLFPTTRRIASATSSLSDKLPEVKKVVFVKVFLLMFATH